MGHEPSPKYPWHHGEIKERIPIIYLEHFQHKRGQNEAKRPPSWTFEHEAEGGGGAASGSRQNGMCFLHALPAHLISHTLWPFAPGPHTHTPSSGPQGSAVNAEIPTPGAATALHPLSEEDSGFRHMRGEGLGWTQ